MNKHMFFSFFSEHQNNSVRYRLYFFFNLFYFVLYTEVIFWNKTVTVVRFVSFLLIVDIKLVDRLIDNKMSQHFYTKI